MEPVSTTTEIREMLHRRIDAVIDDMYRLRSPLMREAAAPEDGVSDEPFGVLGTGTWDGYDGALD